MRILTITEAAMAVALSVLLGNIRLLELPNGGSIAFATLPLLAYSAHRGLRAGLVAGFSAGAAHALIGGTIIHPAQLGLDYLLAYAALALIAIPGASTPLRRICGILLAMSAHLACAALSGVIFFSPTAGSAALVYSLAYNATTVAPETLLALWLLPTLLRAIARANPAQGWRSGLLALPPAIRRVPRSIHAYGSIDRGCSGATRPPGVTSLPAPTRQAAGADRTRPARRIQPAVRASTLNRPAPFAARTPLTAALRCD